MYCQTSDYLISVIHHILYFDEHGLNNPIRKSKEKERKKETNKQNDVHIHTQSAYKHRK